MKKKACRKCKFFVEGDKCPLCNGSSFSTNWQGRVYIINSKKSLVSSKMNIQTNGEYTIKLR